MTRPFFLLQLIAGREPAETSAKSYAALMRIGQACRVFSRRARYITRFIYWTARHGSTRHVAWVLAFEGYSWN